MTTTRIPSIILIFVTIRPFILTIQNTFHISNIHSTRTLHKHKWIPNTKYKDNTRHLPMKEGPTLDSGLYDLTLGHDLSGLSLHIQRLGIRWIPLEIINQQLLTLTLHTIHFVLNKGQLQCIMFIYWLFCSGGHVCFINGMYIRLTQWYFVWHCCSLWTYLSGLSIRFYGRNLIGIPIP